MAITPSSDVHLTRPIDIPILRFFHLVKDRNNSLRYISCTSLTLYAYVPQCAGDAWYALFLA